MEATLEDTEDSSKVVKDLQAKAEMLVEDHKQHLLQSIRELNELRGLAQEAFSLENNLKVAQERLNELRTNHPALFTQKLTEDCYEQ